MLNIVEFLHCGHSLLIRLISIGILKHCLFSRKEIGSNYVCKTTKSNVINDKAQLYFVISASTKSFIDSLIDYYISEASSYSQMAKLFSDEVVDIPAATFGIIVGSVYSAFIQSYTNQQQKPTLEDIQEFTQIVKKRAAQIKRGILDSKS